MKVINSIRVLIGQYLVCLYFEICLISFFLFYLKDVKLTGFPDDTKLGQDLKSFASNNKREVSTSMIYPIL